ncbi:accessory Sec system protein Asp2 [Paenibacillus alvei]
MLKTAESIMAKLYTKNVLKTEKNFKIKADSGRIKYIFQENKESDDLLVIFSGFPLKGKPPVYNYISTFRNLECNKLFILDDFGNDYRGTYYLGTNEDWFLKDEITNLISHIKNKTGIKNENITLTGSSKGGFAALFYAFKDTYGSVIAGEPQILVGDYVSKKNIGVFNNIMGEYSEEKKEKLNKTLFEVIEERGKYPSKIIVICGKENDWYLKNHIYHLTSFLDKKGVSHELVLRDFSDHSQIAKFYPESVFEHYNMK